MNVTAIIGTQRRETTYHLTNFFLRHILEPGDHLTRFTLPKDMPHFCVGCGNCFNDETTCPHRRYVAPIEAALDAADLIVLASPVYVLHASGQMKALLDHFGYRFMIHRPEPSMFRKQALVITQAAGGGTRSAAEDMEDSLDFWGVGRTYTYGINVRASSWQGVPERRKRRMNRDAAWITAEIREEAGLEPDGKVKALFHGHRLMIRHLLHREPDLGHWRRQGWLDGAVPWKD